MQGCCEDHDLLPFSLVVNLSALTSAYESVYLLTSVYETVASFFKCKCSEIKQFICVCVCCVKVMGVMRSRMK